MDFKSDSGTGCHFYPVKGTHSKNLSLDELFFNAASPLLPRTSVKEHKFDEDVQYRHEQYKNDWNWIEQTLDECIDSVYEPVLAKVVNFLEDNSAANSLTDSRLQNLDVLPSAVIEMAASTSEDAFFAHLERKSYRNWVTVRLEAEQEKSQDMCIRRICNRYLKNVPTERTISSLGHLAAFHANNHFAADYSVCEENGSSVSKRTRRCPVSKIVVIFENFEKFDGTLADDLIRLLAGYSHQLPFALVFGVSTNARSLLANLSKKAYAALSLKVFRFQSPSKLLDLFWKRIAFNHKIAFKFHPKMLALLFGRFLNEDFSTALLRKSFRLALLEHYLKQSTSFILCLGHNRLSIRKRLTRTSGTIEEIIRKSAPSFSATYHSKAKSGILEEIERAVGDLQQYTDCFRPVLLMLYRLLVGQIGLEYLATGERDLHRTVTCEQNFFQARSEDGYSIYSNIEKTMNTWSSQEWIDRLEGCLDVLEKENSRNSTAELVQLTEICEKLKHFISDLSNIQRRQEERDTQDGLPSSTNKETLSTKTRSKKITLCRFLEQNETDLEIRKRMIKMDVFSEDKRCILSFLRSTFQKHLCQPEKLPLYECMFGLLSQGYRDRTFAHPNRSFDATLMCAEKRFLPKKSDQLDTTFAFTSLQEVASNAARTIPVEQWFKAFVSRTDLDSKSMGIDEEEKRARFYKSASELELLGVVKTFNKNNEDNVRKAYWIGPLLNI